VMFEMATGRLPFAGASPSETVTNVLDKAPPLLTTLAPDRPKALETLVHKLLAKRASDRLQTAREVGDLLEKLGGRRGWSRLLAPWG
jgi:serine/threonine protein kinase